MFVKVTSSGGRRYVQLVESYRDESGRVKKRTVATLGRADQAADQLGTSNYWPPDLNLEPVRNFVFGA